MSRWLSAGRNDPTGRRTETRSDSYAGACPRMVRILNWILKLTGSQRKDGRAKRDGVGWREKKQKLALHVLNNFLGILGSGHLVLGILR